jgi:hypothetical protein
VAWPPRPIRRPLAPARGSGGGRPRNRSRGPDDCDDEARPHGEATLQAPCPNQGPPSHWHNGLAVVRPGLTGPVNRPKLASRRLTSHGPIFHPGPIKTRGHASRRKSPLTPDPAADTVYRDRSNAPLTLAAGLEPATLNKVKRDTVSPREGYELSSATALPQKHVDASARHGIPRMAPSPGETPSETIGFTACHPSARAASDHMLMTLAKPFGPILLQRR